MTIFKPMGNRIFRLVQSVLRHALVMDVYCRGFELFEWLRMTSYGMILRIINLVGDISKGHNGNAHIWGNINLLVLTIWCLKSYVLWGSFMTIATEA